MTVRIGNRLRWRYFSNWHEKKVAPGYYKFLSMQTKTRKGKQMSAGQGQRIGGTYFWFIKARQVMHKISPNKYIGRLQGTKRFIKYRG